MYSTQYGGMNCLKENETVTTTLLGRLAIVLAQAVLISPVVDVGSLLQSL